MSVAVKVYPPTPVTYYPFFYSTKKDSDAFWSLSAYLYAKLPRLAEAGLMGYHFLNPDDQSETKDDRLSCRYSTRPAARPTAVDLASPSGCGYCGGVRLERPVGRSSLR